MSANLLGPSCYRQWLIIQGRLFAKPLAVGAAGLRGRIFPEQQEQPGE
jgi:hypothetical protein